MSHNQILALCTISDKYIVPLMVFEMLRLKLKNEIENKNNCRNYCHINSPIQTKLKVDIHMDLSYHSVLSKVKVQIRIFKCTRIMDETLSIPHTKCYCILCD